MATDESGTTNLATGGALALLNGAVGTMKNKWEGSKGQEVFTNVSSSIDQDTKELFTNAKKRFFNPAYIRSPTVFFGIGEPRPFFIEKSPTELLGRMKHNMSFFYLNYAIISSILFFLTLVTSRAILGIVILGIGWASFLKASSSGSLTLGGFEISQQRASIGMTVISGCWLFYLLSHVFWYTMSSSGFLIAAHGLFRDASMHKDEEDKVEMSGDLSLGDDAVLGEDAAFLNPVEGVESIGSDPV